MSRKISIIAVLFVLLFWSYSLGRRREVRPVELKRISAKLYEIVGGRGSQGGAYIGENGVLVIDAKQDKASVDAVIAEIGKVTDRPIKYLVNTHSDGDHITGNRYFPKSVTVVAHENCRADFFRPGRSGQASQWGSPELLPFVPSVTYREKMDLWLGVDKVELWYFGVGHTTGDTVVYFPKERVAFLGDQIFVGRAQLIHSYKGGNSFEHVKTLTKMLDTLEAERFCSGHSEILGRNDIRRHIDQMKQRREKVKKLLAQGKSKEQIKGEFPEGEGRLIEAIIAEVENR